jgi:nucleotide-binding universal stress UspA family protein
MDTKNKVLACVDQSRFSDYVADYAAWAARRMQAPLELLHVIDRHPEIGNSKDHSGAIGIDAQESLLTELSERDEAQSKALREQGRIFLDRLRERAIAAGVESPDVRQRHGTLEQTLIEQQQDVRLFVIGRRGESADVTQRDLGRNVERVVRALNRPILTVAGEFTQPRRILLAFDGGAASRKGLELVASSPLFQGLPVHLLMSGKVNREAQAQLDRARETLEQAGFQVTASAVPGDTESVIARTIVEQDIDMLIMGAYAHSPVRSLLLGSTTNDVLRSAKIPTLLLR